MDDSKSGTISNGPLDDGFARREKRAGAQQTYMKRFFDSLTGAQRREMRRAASKITKKKESMAEMFARLQRK